MSFSLNLQLFERTHRGLAVTEAGKSLYNDAKYIIQYSKESLMRAREAVNYNDEIIHVGISPMTPPEIFVELWPKIQEIYLDMNIVDFELYNVEAFNRCENNNEVLLAFKSWESVHPLIRIIPVEWDYKMPFGILHSKTPSAKVKRLIKAINKVK